MLCEDPPLHSPLLLEHWVLWLRPHGARIWGQSLEMSRSFAKQELLTHVSRSLASMRRAMMVLRPEHLLPSWWAAGLAHCSMTAAPILQHMGHTLLKAARPNPRHGGERSPISIPCGCGVMGLWVPHAPRGCWGASLSRTAVILQSAGGIILTPRALLRRSARLTNTACFSNACFVSD